jgi:hypothetical protein
LLLLLITNDLALARRAEDAGIERIMVDLERMGKSRRQAGGGFFISNHTWEDVERLRTGLVRARIQVRINPWHEGSAGEIDEAARRGAEIIMLPMVRGKEDVLRFRDVVKGRMRTSLLVETKAGLAEANKMMAISGIDEVHVGLNDLAIDLGHKVIFETICERLLDNVAEASHRAGVLFGFGGVTTWAAPGIRLNPELILAEQARLKSDVGWLGRSFRHRCETATTNQLSVDVRWIRETVERWLHARPEAYEENLWSLSREVGRWKAELA